MANDATTTAGSPPKVNIDMSTFVPTIKTGISSGQPGPAGQPSQPTTPSMPSQDDVNRMATVYGLDPAIINKQIMQESSGNPAAVSKKGARGPMQLMPATAARLGIDNIDDPVQNLDGGMREMSRLLTKYDGNYAKALSAYNAGEDRVDAANGIPNISETQNYVNSILKGTNYENQLSPTKPVSKSTGIKIDMSTFKPTINPSTQGDQLSDQPSAPVRYAQSFNQSMGMPNDVRDIPKVAENLTSGPIPTSIGGVSFPAAGPLNAAINFIKGNVQASGEASKKGMDQFTQPGIGNKAAGALKYVIGGLPIAGPSIVRSMEEAEKGNYAGMLGTLSGLGLQSLSSNPDVAAAHLDAAGKYLFSKPRVQETILSGETQEMLRAAESAARAKGHAMFPTYEDIQPVAGHYVTDIAQKALNDNITGITSTPKPIADILGENPAKFKRIGAIEAPGGELTDIFTRMSSNNPVSMDELHNYYTKLGEYGAKDLPGDVYAAVKQTRDGIGKLIGEQYESAAPEPATKTITSPDGSQRVVTNPNVGKPRLALWEDAKSYWHDLATHWFDRDSPLRQSLDAKDPSAILKPLTGDQAERATSYLRNYTNEGADPNSVKAIGNYYKGLNQMQLRGLLQASGGLLLSYMMRSEGAPAQAAAAAAGALLGRRLVTGYFRTRPSLTSLLAEAAEKPSLGRQLPPLDLTGINIPGLSGPKGGGNSPGGGPSNPSTPSGSAPVESDITPTESTFLSSIANHPAIHPELSADIKAATQPEVMMQTPVTSRATPTGNATLFNGENGQLPSEVHANLEKQAGRKLSNEDAIALDRANHESQMATGNKGEDLGAIRETHRAGLEKKGRPDEGANTDMTASDLSKLTVNQIKEVMSTMKKHGMTFAQAVEIYNRHRALADRIVR